MITLYNIYLLLYLNKVLPEAMLFVQVILDIIAKTFQTEPMPIAPPLTPIFESKKQFWIMISVETRVVDPPINIADP